MTKKSKNTSVADGEPIEIVVDDAAAEAESASTADRDTKPHNPRLAAARAGWLQAKAAAEEKREAFERLLAAIPEGARYLGESSAGIEPQKLAAILEADAEQLLAAEQLGESERVFGAEITAAEADAGDPLAIAAHWPLLAHRVRTELERAEQLEAMAKAARDAAAAMFVDARAAAEQLTARRAEAGAPAAPPIPERSSPGLGGVAMRTGAALLPLLEGGIAGTGNWPPRKSNADKISKLRRRADEIRIAAERRRIEEEAAEQDRRRRREQYERDRVAAQEAGRKASEEWRAKMQAEADERRRLIEANRART